MVAVNKNIFQLISGNQGNQSKAAAKEGNVADGDFLMALFAATDDQQTALTKDVTDQQQKDQVLMDVLNLDTSVMQELLAALQTQPKEPQQVGEAPEQVALELLGKLESLLTCPQIQVTSELKDTINQVQVQLQNQQLAAAAPKQVNEELKGPQSVGEVPKQVEAVLLSKLESLLASPQLQVTSEQKDMLKQVQIQLQNQQSTEALPKQVTAELLGKLDSLLASPQLQLNSELKDTLKQVHVQLQNQQSAPTTLRQVDVELLSKLEKLLANFQSQPKEMIPNPKMQLNETLATVDLKQQTPEVAAKDNLATELTKAILIPQNKNSTEAQPVEQNANKQEVSVSGQYVKPATERPVEQVLQQVVKNTEASVQSADNNQSFATVTHNKVAGMDAKVDLVQPEQLATRLLGMVKEMATKQQPNQTTMHLKLNPEHLGEVTVRLTYNRGELNAQFYAATAYGKEALEAALPQMRDALYQQQVKLNEAAVYLNNGGGNQWLGGRQGNQGGNRGRSQGGYYTNNSIQTKVGAVPVNNHKVVDDGLNILI